MLRSLISHERVHYRPRGQAGSRSTTVYAVIPTLRDVSYNSGGTERTHEDDAVSAKKATSLTPWCGAWSVRL